MWDVTAAVVWAWDPYSLLAGGAPADELDREIASLVAHGSFTQPVHLLQATALAPRKFASG